MFFGRPTVDRKMCLLFWQERSARATSLGYLFVVSAVGLYLHLQVLLAFLDTSNLSSEHCLGMRQRFLSALDISRSLQLLFSL